jgi:hypothetical protein
VALLGAGIAALTVNGSCATDPLPAGIMCPRIYNTAGIGGGLTALGGALAITGIVVVAVPPRSPPPAP